jgi:hypothetical protein
VYEAQFCIAVPGPYNRAPWVILIKHSELDSIRFHVAVRGL